MEIQVIKVPMWEDLDLSSDPIDAPSGSFEDMRSENDLFCTYMDMEKLGSTARSNISLMLYDGLHFSWCCR